MKMAACVFIQDHSGLILAVSRKDDLTAFGLPGGKVDLKETTEEAAVRELFEETGISINVEDLNEIIRRVCEGEDDYDAVTYQVQFKESMKNAKSMSEEETGIVEWVPWQKLFDGPFSSYNKNLKEIIDGINSRSGRG